MENCCYLTHTCMTLLNKTYQDLSVKPGTNTKTKTKIKTQCLGKVHITRPTGHLLENVFFWHLMI